MKNKVQGFAIVVVVLALGTGLGWLLVKRAEHLYGDPWCAVGNCHRVNVSN